MNHTPKSYSAEQYADICHRLIGACDQVQALQKQIKNHAADRVAYISLKLDLQKFIENHQEGLGEFFYFINGLKTILEESELTPYQPMVQAGEGVDEAIAGLPIISEGEPLPF